LQIKTYYEEGNASNLPCPEELRDSEGNWSSGIPTKKDGSIDEEKFKIAIEFFAKKNHPIIVVLVFGSTIGHAIDNIQEVSKVLKEVCEPRQIPFWIHVDGALLGGALPYLKEFRKEEKTDENVLNKVFFENPEVCSINISGHKWFGTPWPCGLYL
jgi:histidine decarboxylase